MPFSDIFTHASPEHHAIKALVFPELAEQQNFSSPLTLSYTLSLPTHQAIKDYILRHANAEHIYPLGQHGIAMLRRALNYLGNLFQINFVEDNSVFRAHILGFEPWSVLFPSINYGMAFPKENPIRYLVYREQKAIADYGSLGAYYIFLHEFCHLLGLKHPNEGRFRLWGEDTTDFSIMNFFHRYENGLPIYPLTLMPFDIEALRYIYGMRPVAMSDDCYYLQHHSQNSQAYKTISTIVDMGGNDTLSAQGYDGNVAINMREGPYARSQLGNGYVTLAFGTEIENAIAGNGENKIVTNFLNNILFVGDAVGPTTITVDPHYMGHDIYFGFNPLKDKIVLECDSSEPVAMQSSVVELMETNISGRNHAATIGAKYIFDEKNSITLAGILPSQLRPENFLRQDNPYLVFERNPRMDRGRGEREISNKIFSQALKGGVGAFGAAFYQAALLTFFLEITTTRCRRYFSSSTAKTINQLIQPLIMFLWGSSIASGASFFTYSLFEYFGFKEKHCQFAGTIAGVTTKAAQNSLPLGLASGLVKTGISIVGSSAGVWAANWATMWACKRMKSRSSQQAEADFIDVELASADQGREDQTESSLCCC